MNVKRILVVDDDGDSRQEVGNILKSNGYHIDYAKDSISAEKQLQNKNYDLVFVDNYMPDFTNTQSMEAGIRLLKEIKKINPHLPVIIITVYDSLKLTADAIKAGANDYIMKETYSEKELLDKTYELIFRQPLKKEIIRYFEINNETDEYELFRHIQSKFKILMPDFNDTLRELITEKRILRDDNYRIRKYGQKS